MTNNNTAITNLQVDDTAIQYERANKVSVKPLGDGYQADFYRTHKHIATLKSNETGWECPKDVNKTAEREDFRKFAIEHAADIQVEYDPGDRRTPRNTRIPTYADDGMVQVDAANMLMNDITRLLDESNTYGVKLGEIIMESITPKTTTSKGTSLDLLGITDGKYLNGNWAWADIDMVATFTMDEGGKVDQYSIQMLYPMELVSGQLKKNRLTKTSFADGIYEELLAMGKVEKRLTAEEKKAMAKAEKSAKAEKVGLGDEEHEGLHMDMTPTEEAAAMVEAEKVLAETDKKAAANAKRAATRAANKAKKLAEQEQVEG